MHSLQQAMIHLIEKRILVTFLEIIFIRLFITSSARSSKFDHRNVILFQIKVFGGNIKVDYSSEIFHKNNCGPSFTRLTVIKRINRVH